jgi:hypothetical protein
MRRLIRKWKEADVFYGIVWWSSVIITLGTLVIIGCVRGWD